MIAINEDPFDELIGKSYEDAQLNRGHDEDGKENEEEGTQLVGSNADRSIDMGPEAEYQSPLKAQR